MKRNSITTFGIDMCRQGLKHNVAWGYSLPRACSQAAFSGAFELFLTSRSARIFSRDCTRNISVDVCVLLLVISATQESVYLGEKIWILLKHQSYKAATTTIISILTNKEINNSTLLKKQIPRQYNANGPIQPLENKIYSNYMIHSSTILEIITKYTTHFILFYFFIKKRIDW